MSKRSLVWMVLVLSALLGLPVQALAQEGATDEEAPAADESAEASNDWAAEESAEAPASEPAPAAESAAVEEAASAEGEGGVIVEAKSGKGITVSTADDDFSMNLGLRLQVRSDLDYVDGADPDTVTSIFLRRARVTFKGHVFGKNNKYKLQFDALGSELLDFYADFTHVRDLNVRVGRGKAVFSREQLISSGKLAFVDRSIVDGEFKVERDVGVMLHSSDLFGLDMLSYYLGVYSVAAAGAHDFNYLYAGRVEFAPFGNFKDAHDMPDFERYESPKLSVGAGFAFRGDSPTQRPNRSGDYTAGTADIVQASADAIFKWNGLSVFGEFILRNQSRNGEPDPDVDPSRGGTGFVAQAGYLLPLNIEVGGRFAMNADDGTEDADPDDDTAVANQTEMTVGVSEYYHKHAMKVQLDAGTRWDTDNGDPFDTFIARLQLQLMM